MRRKKIIHPKPDLSRNPDLSPELVERLRSRDLSKVPVRVDRNTIVLKRIEESIN